MRYAVPSIHESEELAENCRNGKCPLTSSSFICPFVPTRWPGGIARCNEVDKSFWDEIAVGMNTEEDEQFRQDVIYNLARLAHIRRLHSECKESDALNKWSLQAELLNIQEELDRLAEMNPELYQKVAQGQ